MTTSNVRTLRKGERTYRHFACGKRLRAAAALREIHDAAGKRDRGGVERTRCHTKFQRRRCSVRCHLDKARLLNNTLKILQQELALSVHFGNGTLLHMHAR